MSKMAVTAEHILNNMEMRQEFASTINTERKIELTVVTNIIDKHIYFEVKHSVDGVQNFETIEDAVELFNLLIA